MAEYITKEEALRAVEDAMELTSSEYDMIAEKIDNVSAADVAPIEHGRWERRRNLWYCTNCGKGYIITYGMLAASAYNYCPNCGAKMDGGSANG